LYAAATSSSRKPKNYLSCSWLSFCIKFFWEIFHLVKKK